MEKFKEIQFDDFKVSPFNLIGKQWMLITAGNKEKQNAMTASWGGLGVMWNKNVSFVVIRPKRFTKKFVDEESRFSLCFFDENYRKTLSYMGSVSGKDEDKILKSGLKVNYFNDVPFFEESKYVMICKKLYAQDYKPELFFDKDLEERIYPTKDYHTLYISEIECILEK